MSKNISIKEGGTAKQLTVDKLKVNNVGGGTSLWVPEDSVPLGTKNISRNGTYNASDDNLYGYSQVTVRGTGTATGTDSDGDEAVAYTDPQTGRLVTEKVPSSISVETPPVNPYGIYTDGQSIAKNGMVVKAYMRTGDEYGTVPNSEVTLTPATATFNPETVVSGGDATVEDTSGLREDTIANLPIPYGYSIMGTTGTYETGMAPLMGDAVIEVNGSEEVYVVATYENDGYIVPYAVSKGYFSVKVATHNPGGQSSYVATRQATHFMRNDKHVYFSQILSASRWELITPNFTQATNPFDVAYVVAYGTKRQDPMGSLQTITATWQRPRDEDVLSDTFDIRVAPPYSYGDE